MSAHHTRLVHPAQSTARLSMTCGAMASLWETVPAAHQCRYPAPDAVGEATDITHGEFVVALLDDVLHADTAAPGASS